MKRITHLLKTNISLDGLRPKSNQTVVFLQSNGQGIDYYAIGENQRMTLPVGKTFSSLKHALAGTPDWWFGYLGYDLKNELEDLESKNNDNAKFPSVFFFQPKHVLEVVDGKQKLHSLISDKTKARKDLLSHFESAEIAPHIGVELKFRTRKEHYLKAIDKLKAHIKRGDIYEANYCHELYAEGVDLKPYQTFVELMTHSPAPFSAYVQNGSFHIMCASPERFIKKEGKRLMSQPIKGTRPRGETQAEDAALKEELANSEKDRRENVMIVDMVRNDLSRSATRNSVQVDELFGIYAFPQVFQMISTVSAELKDGIHPVDAIANAFPMGSMTGTPKIRAMQLIEETEDMKRGVYSGAIGYFTPNLDFDFNVVIRSLLYNKGERYLSACVGGAITDLSDPEEEYEETLVKAKALRRILA